MYRVLKPNGKLTIVTDNRLYAHSLARTIDHINCGSFSWSNIDEPQTEIFPNKVLSVPESDSDSDETVDGVDNTVRPPDFKSNVPTIKVQSGEPGERGDHLETDEGSSYFSRMWKNGSKSRVWNLVLIKKQ